MHEAANVLHTARDTARDKAAYSIHASALRAVKDWHPPPRLCDKFTVHAAFTNPAGINHEPNASAETESQHNVVVSQRTPKYYGRYYRDPQKGTPNFGKP